jgi:predicted TIM-barrel fold metal-dependent hydrolase
LEGTIAELKYALDEKQADGFTLFTSYSEKYPGHPDFKPLWAELDKRNAVVFTHPTHSPTGDWAGPELAQPTVDYPYETTRTASDLIMSGWKRQNPNCKIILLHAGCTLPYLAERLAHLSPTIFRKD